MPKADIVKDFEKCSNYTMLGLLVSNTITGIKRFKDVPKEELISKIFSTIKVRASK